MKTILKIILVFNLIMGLSCTAMAMNITIDDNRRDASSNSWYNTIDREDQEVEPGMIYTQVWDLEGFFLDGSQLSMVGGWDFVNGAPYYSFASGDIFISTGNPPEYGTGADSSVTNYGYEYVFDVNWASKTYDVYALKASGSSLNAVMSYNAPESNPLSLALDGEILLGQGSFNYAAGLTDADTDFLGGSHYRVSGFDLGFLGIDPGTEFYAHFTMGCGNDNLMGKGTISVPEPGNMILMGTGLIVLAGIRRRRIFKK